MKQPVSPWRNMELPAPNLGIRKTGSLLGMRDIRKTGLGIGGNPIRK